MTILAPLSGYKKYVSLKNGLCGKLADVFICRPSMMLLVKGGANFVPIAVPNFRWYISLPGSKTVFF